MNERIRELYKQAHVPDTAIDPSNNMPYETMCFSADKFAELIVKKCADIATNRYQRLMDGGKAIKEHFGVE
jgi:hypothetical protein